MSLYRGMDRAALNAACNDSAAVAVLDVVAGYDAADPYSRTAPRFGVPLPHQREFLGDADAAARYEALIIRLGAVELIDIEPCLEIARLLYDGP